MCFFDKPETSTMPNQIVHKIMPVLKSGCITTRRAGIDKYISDIIIFFILPIAICLFEKNFARRIIKTSFIGSEGPRKKEPKLNHLAPPLDMCPKTNIKPKIPTNNVYKVITRYEFFKNLKSIKEKTKNKEEEIIINNNCLQKIELLPSKVDIVISPNIISVKKQKKTIQSLFLKKLIKFNLIFPKKIMDYFI